MAAALGLCEWRAVLRQVVPRLATWLCHQEMVAWLGMCPCLQAPALRQRLLAVMCRCLRVLGLRWAAVCLCMRGVAPMLAALCSYPVATPQRLAAWAAMSTLAAALAPRVQAAVALSGCRLVRAAARVAVVA
jgi:hypothetical protein